jgi:hypothetical protein
MAPSLAPPRHLVLPFDLLLVIQLQTVGSFDIDFLWCGPAEVEVPDRTCDFSGVILCGTTSTRSYATTLAFKFITYHL